MYHLHCELLLFSLCIWEIYFHYFQTEELLHVVDCYRLQVLAVAIETEMLLCGDHFLFGYIHLEATLFSLVEAIDLMHFQLCPFVVLKYFQLPV